MTFERATTGNETGIKAVKKANDPQVQQIVLLPQSMQKALKQKALDEGQSISELIRGLVQGVL